MSFSSLALLLFLFLLLLLLLRHLTGALWRFGWVSSSSYLPPQKNKIPGRLRWVMDDDDDDDDGFGVKEEEGEEEIKKKKC